VASLHSASLRRRLDALTEILRRRVEHRQRMREYATAAASIRAALAEADIDPAENSGFRHFVHGESEVARWPDTSELQRADAAFSAQDSKLASRRRLVDEVAERIARFAGQPPPHPGAAPFDWYAWALAARSGEPSDPR
jgi:hypothetical protein